MKKPSDHNVGVSQTRDKHIPAGSGVSSDMGARYRDTIGDRVRPDGELFPMRFLNGFILIGIILLFISMAGLVSGKSRQPGRLSARNPA